MRHDYFPGEQPTDPDQVRADTDHQPVQRRQLGRPLQRHLQGHPRLVSAALHQVLQGEQLAPKKSSFLLYSLPIGFLPLI